MMEILCIIAGIFVGTFISQRIGWWLLKKYYVRQFRKTDGVHTSYLCFNTFELMLRVTGETLKNPGVEFMEYRKVDFSRQPYRVILKITTNKLQEKE